MTFLAGTNQRMMHTGVAGLRVWVLLNALLYFVSPISVGYGAFRRAIMFGVLLNGVHTVLECGRPRFTKEYAQQLFQSYTFHLAISGIAFIGASPISLALFPVR